MTLLERIDHDLKEAMKSKDEAVLSTLRLVRSALKNKQIDKQAELSEEESIAVIRSMVKQYRDALADFTAASRQDLIEKQSREISILEAYLPPQMPVEELQAICERVMREMNASPKDMGKVIGVVMKEVQGRADGSVAREIIQKLFNV